MPIPATPDIIPLPFAANGQKNTIPEVGGTTTDPAASWTSGFPPITMVNKQAGGKPPHGKDFNGIFNALSQHIFFSQSGCVYPWMGADEETGFAGLNYLKGCHVLGSDGEEYIAVQPSGPDVPATGGGYVGPVDPVNDTGGTYWKRLRSGGTMPSGAVVPFYNVSLGGTANRNPVFWGETEPDTGWLICDGGSDGQGGTVPDLREKFIMGASDTDDAGQTGGAASATPTVTVTGSTSQITVQGTTLNVNQMPSHAHGLKISLQGNTGNTSYAPDGNGNYDNTIINTVGGSQSHTHGVTDPTHTHTATSGAISTLPPFYSLIYCVKLPEV